MANINKENKKNILYVACYVRVSTEEQVKFGFSIQAQKNALEKYCRENRYKYELFVDEGISASSMKRPALQKMLNRISTFDMVVFTKLDRLSRNVLDANTINKILKENNCTMKAIDEDDIDTSTADGTFIFNLKVSLAQREIGKTSERIKFVFNNKRTKGEVTSGTKKYGYDIVNKHYVINEEEAQNIKSLYDFFIEHNGNMKEAYSYFINHFPNKSLDALKRYLRNTEFIGKYKLYRKNIYIDNYIPAIIDVELFNKVQSLIKKTGNITKSNKTTLFDGLLYCNTCKNKITKRIDNRVSNTVRYSCYHSWKHIVGSELYKCTNRTNIREDYIENYLLENFNTEAEKFIIKNSQITENLTRTADNSFEIKQLKKKLVKLKDLYIDDLIDKTMYETDYKKYTSKLRELEKQNITEQTREVDCEYLKSLLKTDVKKIYNALTTENKRKFWLSVIDKIYIENGSITEVSFI